MAKYKNILVSKELLDMEPLSYFVHGDDLIKSSSNTGAAKIKCHPRTLSFITRKYADEKDDSSFYRPEEYAPVFFEELTKLSKIISLHPDRTFYVPKIGSGPSNKFFIWEKLIHHNLIKALGVYDNVIFCWDDSLVS